jgi:type VI secretion system secreted protein VgrG
MPSQQPARLKSPLSDDDLLLHSLDARDELGRLFLFELDLLSLKEDLGFDDVLGQEATVELDLPNGGTRYFHGIVSDFAQTGRRGGYVTYSMQLRPWLWFLSRTADCRIFQQMTVPDILKEVFREHGFSNFKDSLSGTYRTWEYCVQYRETDFNFVSRLMEQEGIYYYFVHEAGKHTLVLSDAYGAHSPLPEYEQIPYFPPSDNVVREEHIYDWSFRRSVQPGSYVLRAFDFRKPRANLETNASVAREHAQGEYEIFDYPGEHFERNEGDVYARTRIEEAQAQFERARAVTNARGIFCGGLFELSEYPRDDQKREYLVVASRQRLTLGDYESSGKDLRFECEFEAADSQAPYRSRRLTPKPMVQGPQTAVVVGPSGEEIWTDEYGRVKVQFHWDRYGKSDENSSCWVRVAQAWAGTNWGAVFIPRIGQEVIVDFIEGDPDRPIITGRVYNADNMPPYSLPDDKTRSTLKSRSSKDGAADNFNEIRFEDKKGEEEMYLHAEKNQTVVVENDKNESVGHDNSESIGNDEKIEVGNNRDKSVGVNQSEKIGSNKTISVGANHRESIGANKTISVGANHSETIGSNMTQTVGANKTETITSAKALTIGAGLQVSVGASMNETIGGSRSEQVGGSQSSAVGKDSTELIGKNKSITAGEKMALVSGDDFSITGEKKGLVEIEDELTIKVGKATITMKKNGDILINGKKIDIKGSGDIIIKGKKILEN